MPKVRNFQLRARPNNDSHLERLRPTEVLPSCHFIKPSHAKMARPPIQTRTDPSVQSSFHRARKTTSDCKLLIGAVCLPSATLRKAICRRPERFPINKSLSRNRVTASNPGAAIKTGPIASSPRCSENSPTNRSVCITIGRCNREDKDSTIVSIEEF